MHDIFWYVKFIVTNINCKKKEFTVTKIHNMHIMVPITDITTLIVSIV